MPKNLKETIRLYKLAANQGNAIAQTNLAHCYNMGKGVPENPKIAAELYTLAADQGHASARTHLASLYYNGRGVEANLETAVKHWRLATIQGNADAQFNLAICHTHGEVMPQNLEKVAELFELAANQGHLVAQTNLGILREGDQKTFRQIEASWNKSISNFMGQLEVTADDEVQRFINDQLTELEVKQREEIGTINLRYNFLCDLLEAIITKSLQRDLSEEQQERLESSLNPILPYCHGDIIQDSIVNKEGQESMVLSTLRLAIETNKVKIIDNLREELPSPSPQKIINNQSEQRAIRRAAEDKKQEQQATRATKLQDDHSGSEVSCTIL